jgi:hypothetical protein
MRVTGRPGHELYLCEPDPAADPWPRGRGRPEYLAATGRSWQDAADRRDRELAAARTNGATEAHGATDVQGTNGAHGAGRTDG